MGSDLISYGLLTSIFVFYTLRMFTVRSGRVARPPVEVCKRSRRNFWAKRAESIDS